MPIDFNDIAVPLGGKNFEKGADAAWLFDLKHFILKLYPDFGSNLTSYRVGIGCVISHKGFTKVMNQIMQYSMDTFQRIIWESRQEQIMDSNETEDAMRRIVTQEIARRLRGLSRWI